MPKTNYDAFMEHVTTVDSLAKFICRLFKNSDEVPWEQWFDKKYCKQCPVIKTDAPRDESGYYLWGCVPVTCAYCEQNSNCRYFPEIDHIPDTEEVLKMWLNQEEDEAVWAEYTEENVTG